MRLEKTLKGFWTPEYHSEACINLDRSFYFNGSVKDTYFRGRKK